MATRISAAAARPGRPSAGEQLLRHDTLEGRGQLDPDLLLLLGREDVDDPVDRLRGVLGVQGGEDQVAGLGRGEGGRDGLEVA